LINIEDQNELFKLIADNIDNDLTCFAIGGTAMMFHGYKNATKDIDLVFHSKKDLEVMVKALIKLGYEEKALFGIYSKERIKDPTKPRMFSSGNERIDLFNKKVFSLELAEEFIGKFEFIGEHKIIMLTPPKEWIIALKIITNRDKDILDIEAIAEIEKNIDWNLVVDIVIKNPTDWLLLDLEQNLQQLKKKNFIRKETFDKIYKTFEKLNKK